MRWVRATQACAVLVTMAFACGGAVGSDPVPTGSKARPELQGPVAVMPVVFRDIEAAALGAEKLAAATRQYVAALLTHQGICVILFESLDRVITDVMPQYWLVDSRGKTRLRMLAQEVRAERVIFWEITRGPTRGVSGAFAKPTVITCGHMEVFDSRGEATHVIYGIEQTSAESKGRTLGRLLWGAAFGMGTTGLPVVGAVPPEDPGVQKWSATEATSVERMTKRAVAAWLGVKDLPDPEVKERELEGASIQGGFWDRKWGLASTRIAVERGRRIGIIAEGSYPEKVAQGVKILELYGKLSKHFEREERKKTAAFAAEVADEIEKACRVWGCVPVVVKDEDFAHTQTTQDFSLECLKERAEKLGCDVLVLTHTGYVRKEGMTTRGYTFVKVVDARSGESWAREATEETAESIARIVFGEALW